MPVMRQFLLLCIFLCPYLVEGQRIEFFKEELVFTLDSACFAVNGDYYFRNPSAVPVNYRILYPVSKTPGYRAIDTILMYDVSKPAIPLPVEINDSVASFSLNISPLSEKCVKIYYKQHHNGSRARYILMTTHHWQRPLEIATYTLVTGNNITVSHFSILPDRSEDFEQTKLSFWSRKQFMPDTDFVFELLKN